MKHRTRREEKYERVYKMYASNIYRICVYLTQDKKVGQQIAEKVFVEFYNYFEKMTPDEWYAYLVYLAEDKAYNWKMKSKNEREGT